MERPEYMKVYIRYFLKDIIKLYNLDDLVHNGYVYFKIVKGMYGLNQATVLGYNNLSTILPKAGYQPIISSLGMWKHTTYCTLFFNALMTSELNINHKMI